MDPTLFTPVAPLPRRVVSVVVERGIDRLSSGLDALTYALPDGFPDILPGQRVEVPLGRSNALVQGVAVAVASTSGLAGDAEIPAFDPARLKSVRRVLESRFPPSLVGLARWLARYYASPLGMVLATMVPASVKQETGRVSRVRLTPNPSPADPDGLTPTAREAWAKVLALPASVFPALPKDLGRAIGAKSLAPINRLTKAGFLIASKHQEVRTGGWEKTGTREPAKAVTPTLAQANGIEAIAADLGSHRVHLIRGVTGSGKTEVYLRAIERVIARGESAIVLVPEISLTPQTAGRFLDRFGHVGVGVLHSGLSASQRHHQWKAAAEGRVRVVVGARSAVFAPFRARTDPGEGAPLGLIVVDEEHDHSYKQDQAPRYHARDIAIVRGQGAGCPVVLGSATPSLESWHNATVSGRANLIELPSRAGGGVLPHVEVVDLAEERRSREGPDARALHAIGPRLERAIRDTLDSGAQAILLLNRRGYASYIACPDHSCGWLMTCAHCDVTMVFHTQPRAEQGNARGATRAGALCRCHHCLSEQKLPVACPVCRKRVNTFGFGTQRLEEEISRKFSDLSAGRTMLRLDADTMSRARDYFEALERFASGEVRLLLGTQMISKGLDFPNVRLVGVINADTALNLPDFRASERTFQLVSQVAGRAGRASRAGGIKDRVIVQTFSPNQPAIRLAAAHDYRGFAAHESELRRHAGLPPWGRMARIVCRDEEPAKSVASAAAIAALLRDPGRPWAGELSVRGPMPCPISRVAGYTRTAVEMLAAGPVPIQHALTALRAEADLKSDEQTAIDVDPVALL